MDEIPPGSFDCSCDQPGHLILLSMSNGDVPFQKHMLLNILGSRANPRNLGQILSPFFQQGNSFIPQFFSMC
eukprot:10106403-Karenia_brevis.AAC.1